MHYTRIHVCTVCSNIGLIPYPLHLSSKLTTTKLRTLSLVQFACTNCTNDHCGSSELIREQQQERSINQIDMFTWSSISCCHQIRYEVNLRSRKVSVCYVLALGVHGYIIQSANTFIASKYIIAGVSLVLSDAGIFEYLWSPRYCDHTRLEYARRGGLGSIECR